MVDVECSLCWTSRYGTASWLYSNPSWPVALTTAQLFCRDTKRNLAWDFELGMRRKNGVVLFVVLWGLFLIYFDFNTCTAAGWSENWKSQGAQERYEHSSTPAAEWPHAAAQTGTDWWVSSPAEKYWSLNWIWVDSTHCRGHTAYWAILLWLTDQKELLSLFVQCYWGCICNTSYTFYSPSLKSCWENQVQWWKNQDNRNQGTIN